MELIDFKIRIFDFDKREYQSKGKRATAAGTTERKLYSFTLSWGGMIKGESPEEEMSYIGATHKGCMLYPDGESLSWTLPRTRSMGGFPLTPSIPGTGLYKRVLARLSQTEEAKDLHALIAEKRFGAVPDPDREYAPPLEIE